MHGLLLVPILLLGVIAPVEAHTSSSESPTVCTMQYQPVCGAKEVQCVRAPCYPQYQTYGNSCMMGVDGATFLHEGECTASETGPVVTGQYVPPAHCTAWFDGCNQCGRGPDGESFCTLRACVGDPAPGYCTAYEEVTEPAPTPAPMPEEPIASSTVSVPEPDSGFFKTVWQQILSFFSTLF